MKHTSMLLHQSDCLEVYVSQIVSLLMIQLAPIIISYFMSTDPSFSSEPYILPEPQSRALIECSIGVKFRPTNYPGGSLLILGYVLLRGHNWGHFSFVSIA